MTRRDRGRWGRFKGSGGTALGVAVARARESSSARPLVIDPYVQLLVDGAGDADSDVGDERSQLLTDYTAARTKWLDDFFLSASAAGVSQVVMLGAGLDTRAWRMRWLSDSVIYDVDHPEVLTYKTHILDASDAQLAAKYMPVPTDLREDWPRALRAAGFDHNEPTAWSAEGLLPYLPSAAQERLFRQIALYSARGSRIALEAFADQSDAAASLRARRWHFTVTDAADLLDRYHRKPASPGLAEMSTVVIEGRLF